MSSRIVERTHIQGVGWLREVLDPDRLKVTVRALCRAIDLSGVRFSHIAFTGMSGSLIGPVLAYELGKYPVAVRRRGETSQGSVHSSHPVEGGRVTVERHEDFPGVRYRGAFRYIVVDDLISTGTSMRHVMNTIYGTWKDARPVGIFLYESRHHSDLSWAPGYDDPWAPIPERHRKTVPVFDGAVVLRERGEV